MRSQRTTGGWVLRFDAGEELVGALTAWAEVQGVVGGSFTGIGAVGEVELGFFHRHTRSYERHTLRGEHEILSLTGNFSLLEGRPFAHAHMVLAGPDLVARGGHLFRGVVTVTCEVHVSLSERAIVRESRPDLGFHPLAPDGD